MTAYSKTLKNLYQYSFVCLYNKDRYLNQAEHIEHIWQNDTYKPRIRQHHLHSIYGNTYMFKYIKSSKISNVIEINYLSWAESWYELRNWLYPHLYLCIVLSLHYQVIRYHDAGPTACKYSYVYQLKQCVYSNKYCHLYLPQTITLLNTCWSSLVIQ